jgi:Skp family chaperone for outer membrane proteins
MKKTILIIAALFWGLNIYSQENDTTKIKLGDTKVIIIDKKNDGSKTKKEKLEQGKEEFEKLLEDKEKELEKHQALIEKNQKQIEEQERILDSDEDQVAKDEAQRRKLELELLQKDSELKIKELEKEVKALEKGIADINNELDTEEDLDWENDPDWTKKEKFDWDFDTDWPRDWDNLSPFGRKKKFRGHWAGFELGMNNYMNKDNQLTFAGEDVNFELDAGRSWQFTINFTEYSIPFGKNVGLVTGLGTDFNNYHFRNNVRLEEIDNMIIATEVPDVKFDKNKIATWSFTMPLLLEIQLHKPNFYISGGIVGKVKVLSWSKQKYELDGGKFKDKTRSDFLMNTFRYGLTARVGFGFLRVFANYDLVPLFQKDRGPELYPVSVGISLISF